MNVNKPAAPAPLKFYQLLYVQVLAAIVLGAALGYYCPRTGAALQPLGDAFVKLIKMIIAPVIFLTVTTGIAGMAHPGKVGRVVGKSLLYFFFFSTLALIIGLVFANVLRPGAGLNISPASLDSSMIQKYMAGAAHSSITAFLLDIIPESLFSPLGGGNILQVLLAAVLFGSALAAIGDRASPVTHLLQELADPVFKVVHIIMKFAPVGAFGAMAFTIGKYGIASLINLLYLVMAFYLTSILFVLVILGLVARYNGFSVIKLISYLKDEILLVLATSSSESALPNMMRKMQDAGCERSVVGLVVPTGYSFNLDGTNIYMTMAALFIAQACNIDLSLGQQLLLLLMAMISSKGAAGVAGAGFITLAATLSIVPTVPIAGITLILGIDKFMSECRAVVNFIGNACATVVVSRWEKALDEDKMSKILK